MIFSSHEELQEIQRILRAYITLPFSGEVIPGALMEAVLAHVRGGQVLKTYDFVDVINPKKNVGWQIKSTKESTPLTWKRAKIPNAQELITESQKSAQGLQRLGDSIIKFCNDHAQESMAVYNLTEIGYSRLIVHKSGKVTYFERILCTAEQPRVFNPNEFVWQWSKPKKTKKKEQFPAFYGVHKPTQKKWWAWHGLGENQLHFSGEKNWWPKKGTKNFIQFSLPGEQEKIPLGKLISLLSQV